jgi:hypothetical protein
MGTKNNPGAFDCYANAEPDEPMFVLLGRDKFAPSLVEFWAWERELDGEAAEKVEEARQCAYDMRKWLADHGKVEKPITSIGTHIWTAHIFHGITRSEFLIHTRDKDLSEAVDAAEAYASNEEWFLPGAEVSKIEYVGVIAA